MLDIKFIRQNPELVKKAIKTKVVDLDLDKLLKIDDTRREFLIEIEEDRNRQNQLNEEIATTENADSRQALIGQSRVLKEKLRLKEEKFKEITKNWQELMLQVPNIPDISVSPGDSDEDNQPIKFWGEKAQFGFTPKDHIELMIDNGWVDLERGVKVAGFRGYFLTGRGVEMSLAIWQWALSYLSGQGFTPVIAPSLLKRDSFLGTGYLPQGEEDLYKTQDGNYLAGTSEVALMGRFMDEILTKEELPIKLAAFSPCFRREAGSHGKDTKGLIRVHEFFKIEQLILGEANHELSVKYHEELTAQAESLMQALKLPYRIVINCGGDLGLGAVKKHDIEAWMPGVEKYRETHSISYFHDWQTRRLNIRYKDESGKARLTHSLNGTATATPRLLAAIAENYQTPDGTIATPEVLKPYLKKEAVDQQSQ